MPNYGLCPGPPLSLSGSGASTCGTVLDESYIEGGGRIWRCIYPDRPSCICDGCWLTLTTLDETGDEIVNYELLAEAPKTVAACRETECECERHLSLLCFCAVKLGVIWRLWSCYAAAADRCLRTAVMNVKERNAMAKANEPQDMETGENGGSEDSTMGNAPESRAVPT